MPSPFDLDNSSTYEAWRARKLAQTTTPSSIAIQHPEQAENTAIQTIAAHCQQYNFARFHYANPPTNPAPALQNLGKQLGLFTLDAHRCATENHLTQITVQTTANGQHYIPYTNQALGWHTDGYYNNAQQQIHAWLLYCAQPAASGGENSLLDHDIAYIRLRDENPQWIDALMATDAFIIPANTVNGNTLRSAQSGPVFQVSTDGQHLHMRYSARQRNIIWKADPTTQQAASFLRDFLTQGSDEHILSLTLQQGEGIISNNILHKRTGFIDAAEPAQRRMLYRARYYQRVAKREDYYATS